MTQDTDTDIAAIADAYRAWSAEMEREAADVAAGNDTVKPDRKRARVIRGFAFIARRAARAEEWHPDEADQRDRECGICGRVVCIPEAKS